MLHPSHLLLVLPLMLNIFAKGEIYNNTRSEQVKIFTEKEVRVCFRSLEPSPSSSPSSEATVTARLIVESTAGVTTYTGGNATISDLKPYVWYNMTIKHKESEHKHVLRVTMGDKSFPFKKSKKHRWTSSYQFREILLFVKGIIELEECPLPTTTTNPVTTTTTTTTTTRTPTTSSKEGQPTIKTTTAPTPMPEPPLFQGTPATSRKEGQPTIKTTTAPMPVPEPPVTKETLTTLKTLPELSPSAPGGKDPLPTKGDFNSEIEEGSSQVHTSHSNIILVVGVIAGVFILVCVALLLLCLCKKKKKKSHRQSPKTSGNDAMMNQYKTVPFDEKAERGVPV